ncbi:MAG: ABC transporter permease [Sulfolobales archaeon]|nr:ABC transporter permease [Sulfolobales archaeon]MCX8209168.1 ABC transporter permease [Sulfolobales archaeon]MDW8011221.1 ABC transporter permease [Sulfolobales archaeon]
MSFSRLLKKEVLSVLKSPAFIASLAFLAIFFVVLGRVIGTATELAVREVLEALVGVVVEDRSEFTAKLVGLANTTLKGRLVLVETVEEGVSRFQIAVVIPEGFGDSLLRPGAVARIRGYVSLDRVLGFQQAKAELVNSVASVLTEAARYLAALEGGINVSVFSRPIVARVEARIGGREFDLNILLSYFTSITMLTVFIGVLATITLVYSAQAVASEKEEKAFEMLLTLPIRRATVAVAKVAGAVVISVLTALVYFFGFLYMLAAPTSQPGEASGTEVAVSLWDVIRYLGIDGVLLLAASLGLVLLFSGTTGILIGTLVSDTKVAGAVAGPVAAILYVGLLVVQFIGVPLGSEFLALGSVVYGLPLVVIVAYIVGEKALALLAICASAIVTAIPLIAVIRVFESEKILLGITIRRARKD